MSTKIIRWNPYIQSVRRRITDFRQTKVTLVGVILHTLLLVGIIVAAFCNSWFLFNQGEPMFFSTCPKGGDFLHTLRHVIGFAMMFPIVLLFGYVGCYFSLVLKKMDEIFPDGEL